MRHARTRCLFLAVLTAACLGGRPSRAALPDSVLNAVVSRWYAPSERAGRRLIEEYGLPDDVTPNQATWIHKGFWKRTVVSNRKPVYRSLNDMNVVEQTVNYPLNTAQAAKVLSFRDNLIADLDSGELTSLADREDVNFLTMNLADEVARGIKTVPEARTAYVKIRALAAAGKTSPYTTGLLFAPKP